MESIREDISLNTAMYCPVMPLPFASNKSKEPNYFEQHLL